jgi:hypothetical protein
MPLRESLCCGCTFPKASMVRKKTSSKCGTSPLTGRRSSAAINLSLFVTITLPEITDILQSHAHFYNFFTVSQLILRYLPRTVNKKNHTSSYNIAKVLRGTGKTANMP